jgi:hypothetical protein
MALYRHNQNGKIFIILESELKKNKVEPNSGDDFILPLKQDISEQVGTNSLNAKDKILITKKYIEGTIGGGENAISSVPEEQDSIIKHIASEDAKLNFNTASNTGQLGIKIKKGKYSPVSDAIEWQDALNEIETIKDESNLNKSVSKLLEENNIYSPENPLIDGIDPNENKFVLGTIAYKSLGVHGPRKFPFTVESDPKINQLTIEDMKAVGLKILLASSGESNSYITNIAGNSVAAIEAANLISSATELGSKVNFGLTKPSKVLEDIKPGFKSVDNNDSVIDNSFSVTSYGSPNNPFKPFTGTDSPLAFAKTLVTLTTISFFLKKIALALNMTGRTQEDQLANGSSRDRQKFLGNSTGNAGSNLLQSALDPFELPQLTNDFFLSLDAGFKQFFGLGDSLISSIRASTDITSMQNYGYYSIFIRKLNAGIQDLVIGGFGFLIENVGANQGSEIREAFSPESLVERLKSNFVLKFIKFLALIGDKVLVSNELQQQSPVPGLETNISVFDGIPEKISNEDQRINPGIIVVKHRLDQTNGGIAYANSNLQSLLLMPQSITDADFLLNGEEIPTEKAVRKLLQTNKVLTNDYINGRIPKAEVKKMEDYLERDYMPFYFHDLRTNEIISFHAFLESASDSIQAEYNEVEGYGRIGVVPIYKNTKRNINFAFKILAVNDNDHDQMWYKLNRLAACLHPQYSEGRILSQQGNKFIQPFSQVFAATPLIRLRLGDLWKSNYSKLAVARLFGLSGTIPGREETFKLATERQISVRQPTDNIRAQQQRRNNEIANLRRPLQPGDSVEIRPTSNKNRWPIVVQSDASSTNARRLGQQIGQYRIVPGAFLYIPSGYVQGEIVEFHPSTRGTGNNYLVRITNTRPNGQQLGFRTISGNRRGQSPTSLFNMIGDDPTGDIVCVNPDRLTRILPPRENVEPPDPITRRETIDTTIADFFKCDGDNANPIMKAFCTTEGKGLACVIKSMNIENIMDAPWVTDKFDGRVPSLVTVNMDITPIYDINPGLDHKGAMVAPIWPSGEIVTNLMGNKHSSDDGYKNFHQSRSVYNFPSVRGPRT